MKRLAPLLLLVACGSAAPEDPQVTAGRAVYQRYCALCHGDNGQGYVADAANALTNQHFLADASDEFLRAALIRGRPGTPMSPSGAGLGGPLTDAQVEQVIAFLRSYQTAPPSSLADVQVAAGAVARGQAVYNVECVSCHNVQGVGKPYMGIANPEFLATASDAYLRAAIAWGRPGTPMPAYAATQTNQAIDDLVALIRSWQQSTVEGPSQLPTRDLGEVVQNPQGPPPAFASQPGRYVPAADLKAAQDAGARLVLLDARPPADYPNFHLPGALSTPFYAVADYLPQLPKDAWIVTYCACPHAESGQAADTLLANGYTTVKVLDEGILYWKAQGWPLHTGVTP